jgi:putative cell wall endopeptidase family protein
MQHYKRLQKISFLLLFSATHTMFGQFNTLSPQLQPEKKKYEKYTIIENKQVDAEKKMQSGLWHKLFKSEKASLRKENDSLKRIIAQKEQQNFSKHITDSLLLLLAKKAIKDSYLIEKEVNTKPENTTKTPKIAMPLNGDLQITSPFGERFHPIWKENKLHNGIDLKANHQFVYAVLDGIISGTGWDNKGGGKFIKVQHSNGIETSYCHLSEVYYQQGEAVKAGFVIARSGNTGISTAPHLHFSVKENDKHINPVDFLNDLITLSR